ncbi:Tat pathway signal sequence domain protein [Nitrospira tepida]|uniref:Tat pathway signal sequence domain protein n=1 Tax=Nitrospira tepida TaxID=2973512 RepID=A0AA86MY15_9BACT|nr:YHS domain-containing (seleno)protein [Nitrospira tepida]CAI4031030.1 Tat pathway signal sequence domain protein [Nitrospira tepida]
MTHIRGGGLVKLASSTVGMMAAICLICAGAMAGEFYEPGGVAIRGYDPVAYFEERRPVKGSSTWTAQFQGSTFYFASAANRDAFTADPERYAPQYGGFCAFGAAKGYKAKTDPDAFSLVNGKLYLNYSLNVRALWQEDIPGYIAKGDKNWPDVRKTTRVRE